MSDLLPTVGKATPLSPNKLKYLMIGPPKFGKTTFFSGVPNVCLLAFEAGYAEVSCPKIVITAWDRPLRQRKLGWDVDEDEIRYTGAQEAIEEIEKHNPYDFIILDTIDQLAKMAGDYMCKQAGVDHPSEGGKYGRGWDVLQTNPVRRYYNRIVRLGCGVAAITHRKDKTDENKFGETKTKRETSLPGGIQHFILTQSDVVMQGIIDKKGRHYFRFDGGEGMLAGKRLRKVYIPNRYYVVPPTRTDDSPPWRQWETFFTNNPEAGKLAEQEFRSLYRGGVEREEENIERHSNAKKEASKQNAGSDGETDEEVSTYQEGSRSRGRGLRK